MTPNGVKIAPSKLPDMSIKVTLALREKLNTPIPRDEVEQIHQVVMAELENQDAIARLSEGLSYIWVVSEMTD